MVDLTNIDEVLEVLPTIRGWHAPSSKLYQLLKKIARQDIARAFEESRSMKHELGPFGELRLPYYEFGPSVSSVNLFDLDELILFAFYWQNRDTYRRVIDAGANIGLHSVIFDRCGYHVRAFEPEAGHFKLLEQNIEANKCANVQLSQAAISSEDGEECFVNTLGNTTSSHLAGAKADPYGDLERYNVRTEAFAPLMGWADLVKMDVEGHEATILRSTNREHWDTTDAVVEIQCEENARVVFEHFRTIGVRLFSQKTNWGVVKDVADMPTSYRDGSLFISCRELMPW
jgi:FkbM family methyltransferase